MTDAGTLRNRPLASPLCPSRRAPEERTHSNENANRSEKCPVRPNVSAGNVVRLQTDSINEYEIDLVPVLFPEHSQPLSNGLAPVPAEGVDPLRSQKLAEFRLGTQTPPFTPPPGRGKGAKGE